LNQPKSVEQPGALLEQLRFVNTACTEIGLQGLECAQQGEVVRLLQGRGARRTTSFALQLQQFADASVGCVQDRVAAVLKAQGTQRQHGNRNQQEVAGIAR
jgi:hypothetical protein